MIDPFASNGKPVEIAGLVGSERVSPAWSSDNRIAYCAKINRNYELRVAKLSADATSGTMEEIGLPGKNTFAGEEPSWAPDNRHVTMTVDGVIYVIDTRLGAKRKLISGQNTMAFAFAATTGRLQQLSMDAANDMYSNFSKPRPRILFAMASEGNAPYSQVFITVCNPNFSGKPAMPIPFAGPGSPKPKN